MKITVIGGSGFIGSHVADCLSKKGHRVKIFDKKKSRWLKKNQKIFIGDIFNYDDLNKSIKGSDIVYNFAALSDLNKALTHPIETVKSNILGTVNALEISRKNKIKRFIQASTIYANSSEGGFYRCSKKAAEDYVEEYKKTFGIDFTVLRFGTVYGPRSDQSNGVYSIISNGILKRKISYVGSKEAVREYIHVIDAAKASVDILKKNFKNKYVLITGSKAMKVGNFLKILSKILKISEKIHFQNKKNTGHYIVKPSIYKAKLGKKYITKKNIGFKDGLIELVEIIKNKYGNIEQ